MTGTSLQSMSLVSGMSLRAAPSLLRSLGFLSQANLGGRAQALLPNLRLLVDQHHGPQPGLLVQTPLALPSSIDGLPCSPLPLVEGDVPCHPNGVSRCDHIVLRTPDWATTTAALQELGWEEALVREDVYPGTRLSFFRVGAPGRGLALEVMAPLVPRPHPAQGARVWGVAWVAGGGLEQVAGALAGGLTLSPGKAAVQPRRRIATLRGDTGGVTMAFLTERVDTEGAS